MKNPKDRVITAILLLIVLFILYSIVIYSSSEISVSAKAAALYEPVTNSFLFTKNADDKMPMASTTKIMTALVAIENFPLDKKVRVDDKAIGIEGSSLYLKQNETLTMRDLIAGLMLRSANDAAAAIAYAVAGGIEEFAELMNSRASELGLKNTHFMNPHGLDDPQHYTTAKELAILAGEALRNQTFKDIVSAKTLNITNEDGEARLVTNHNKLLSLYDGAIGVKTGFTKKSGRCLVGACERDGLQFITVTINAPDDWNDHSRLFDYGYSKLELRHIAAPGDFSYNIPIIGANEDFIKISNNESFALITERTKGTVQTHIKLMRYAASPITKNEIMGKVIFTLDGVYIGEINLVAENDVPVKEKENFFSKFK